MTRKVLSTVLAVAMVLSMLAGITLSANAAEINSAFTKVTNLADVTSGEYLIVESNIAMVSTEDTASTYMAQSGELTVADSSIAYDGTDVTAAAIWTITKDDATGTYTIADKNGSYLATVSGQNRAVLSETAEAATITASDVVEGAFTIEQADRFLGHNNSATRYAFYATAQNASVRSHLELYKLGADAPVIDDPVETDFSGRYYFAAKRSLGICFYMTSELSTGSTPHYMGVNSGISELPESITAPELNQVFRIEKSGTGYKIAAEGVDGENNYLGWTSGNTGALVSEENAVVVTITEVNDSVNIMTEGGRYLALNSQAPNDYFAWYPNTTTMIKNIALVPISSAAHFHTWGEGVVSTAPTCTEEGLMIYTCSGCNETKSEVIPALGHDFVDGICSRCGAAESSVVTYNGKYAIVAARSNGNFFMTGVLTDSTIKRYTAVAADFTEIPSEITEAPENGTFVITPADNGYTIKVDGISGNSYLGWTSGNSGALVSEANAPVLTITENQDGTVKIALNADRALALNSTTTNNYFAWYQNAQILDLHLIPIVESQHTHVWTETFVSAPTCTEDGWTDYTCSICGETKTETIPALGHDYVDGVCSRCGEQEPVAADYSGKYYFAAKRASGNYFYMTSDLGTASTQRYQAIDSGVETLPQSITAPEAGYVFSIEKSGTGYKIAVDGTEDYLGWTSGNSGILVAAADASVVAITDNNDGTVTITIPDRNLALNNSTGNDFFAWYASAQANHITLIPVEEDTHLDADLKFLSRNLNLQSYIGVDYTVNTSKTLRDKYSDFYVVAEFDGSQVSIPLLRSATSYKVYELKTTATQMTEEIKATIYAYGKADGELYHSAVNTWTVRDGIMDMLRAETDAARRQLQVDMLKYGAAAQIVFGKNVDNLADSELGDFAQYATTTNPTIAATTSVSGNGVAFRTKSLSLASSIEMQFMFSYKNLTLSNLEARIIHDGQTRIVPITAATSTYAGFSYEGLASNELRKNITVAVYDKTTGQPVTQILTVSVEALAAEKLSDYASDAAKLELLNAVMRYGDSAQAVYGN